MGRLEDALRQVAALEVRSTTPMGQAHGVRRTRVRSSQGDWLVKSAPGPSDQLAAEADGLEALRSAATDLIVPQSRLYLSPSGEEVSLLLIEWLRESPDSGSDTRGGFLGRGLAALHRRGGSGYGYTRDNFIGRGHQPNPWTKTWPAFFGESRILAMVSAARSLGRWPSRWDRSLDALLHRLPELLPTTPTPALVHGDLWGGNYLRLASGQAALIDPAVYYGHSEVDLAMTTLFGGFDSSFYDAYHAASGAPPDSEWADRRDVYNLYHVINHLNLFGDAYESQVAATLSRF